MLPTFSRPSSLLRAATVTLFPFASSTSSLVGPLSVGSAPSSGPSIRKKPHENLPALRAAKSRRKEMNSERPIVRVDFTQPAPAPAKTRGYQHLGSGDYIDRRTGHHYENVRLNGRYTWRKLSALTHAAAIKEIRKKRSDYELSKRGLAEDPYKKIESRTVADLARFYLAKN